MSDMRSRVEKYQEAHRRYRLRFAVVALLVLAVVTVTSVSQFMVAYTQTKTTYCGLDHEHTLECYSNPDADVETPEVWERLIPDSAEDETEVERLLAIARSQLGYRESTRNYAVEDDEMYGYTRYGDWMGDPYATWNEAFAQFCLYYAGIDEWWFPYSDNAWDWVDLLIEASEPYEDGTLPEQLFYAAGDYEPQPGDLVFYETDDGNARVGIVEQAMHKAKQVNGKSVEYLELKAIEGDVNGAVKEVVLHDDTDKLVGYGAMPAELREKQDDEEPVDEPVQDVDAGQDFGGNQDSGGQQDEMAKDDGTAASEQGEAPAQRVETELGQNDGSTEDDQNGDAGHSNGSGQRIEIELGQHEDDAEAGQADADKAATDDAGAGPTNGDANADVTDEENNSGTKGGEDAKAGQDGESVPGQGGEDLKDVEVEDGAATKQDVEAEDGTKSGRDAGTEDDAAADEDAEFVQDEQEAATSQDASADSEQGDSSTPGGASLTSTDSGLIAIAQTLSTEVDGYQITVDLFGQVPEGLTLQAIPLEPTRKQLKAVEQSLSEELEDGATKKARVQRSDVRAFDIRVVDQQGNEVSLDSSAKVRVVAEAGAEPVLGATTPEVVHLGEGEPEHLETEANASGFAFETDGFSPYVFVYTVDFEYQGYAWSMPGGSSVLLSTVLQQLGSSIDMADVTDADFSNPELVEVLPCEDGVHDWWLTSLQPFDSNETLTLTLADGSVVVIDVTDDTDDVETILDDDHRNQNPNIRRLLDRVQFYDGETLVGDSRMPDSMVVRPGHEYTMRLEFSEDEDKSADEGQLPDDGYMYYGIPDGVILSPKAFKEVDGKLQVPFSIVLDRKHTLENNIVTYVPASQSESGKAYLKIEWNKSDTANYKLLKASPRTTFMLSFPYTTVEVADARDIYFSDDTLLTVDPDATFDVSLEKKATVNKDNKETLDYEVIAIADGNVADVTFTDVMGAALTYIEGNGGLGSGVSITYKRHVRDDENGDPVYEEYNPLPDEYGPNNKSNFHIAEGDHGFDFRLAWLKSTDMAVIKYSAHVDYAKLGGKNNIEVTSKNTVRARDNQDRLLAEASQALDTTIDYLQIGKARGEIQYVGYEQNENGENVLDENGDPIEININGLDSSQRSNRWQFMYVKWKVIYNPDHQINVEGATLKDTVWMGKKYSTSYVTGDPTKPFTVTAYANGTFTKDNGSSGDSFAPADGDSGIQIIDPSEANGYGWADAEKNVVTVTTPDATKGQKASWEWTIPDKSKTAGTDETAGLDANTPYVYVIEYWTKIAKEGQDSGGYVGNQVIESIADITRDKSVELPGVGPGWEPEIKKEHIKDEYTDDGKVYTNWEISFYRQDFGLERALVEDTLPHILLKDEKGERVCTDRFVGADGPAKYQMKVKGLVEGQEQCVPSLSLDGYDVVFWFFTNTTPMVKPDPNIDTPGQGLLAAADKTTDDDSEEEKARKKELRKITISFWTENDKEWIEATANGNPTATNEHWNHVHLVLNGKEAVDKTYAVPKPEPSIKKSVETVGSWYDPETQMTLPVYRYTLTLSGLSDDLFGPKDDQGNHTGDTYTLDITDEFNPILEYLPVNVLPEATNKDNRTTTITSANTALNGKTVTLNDRAASDEKLVRPLPTCDTKWSASFTGPTDIAATSTTEAKKQLAIQVSLTAAQREQMKYRVMKEGSTPENPLPLLNEDNSEVWVYGRTYEVSYYLAPNFAAVKALAQDMVKHNRTSKEDTTLTFKNTATWENAGGEAGKSTFDATTDYNLNPVQKKLVNYNDTSELATYSIDVNPLRLRMNNGQRYPVSDVYSNLAVDFQTVHFTTFPENDAQGRPLKDQIEWSYHNNKGTFWVPDETRVTITYEGWPVGKHGANGLTFSNTASIGDYQSPEKNTIKLKVDHEGYASTYRVRIFKFEDDNMDKPLEGAVFQLFDRDANGNIVPMTYGVSHGIDGDNAFNHWNNEDDEKWFDIEEEAARGAGILNSHGFIPTPERHYAGDYIYFVSGKHVENKDTYNSEQKGFADVMLSQSRDGVSLKKNKQYYLREVLVPEGHTMEDIYWRFIIGDDDDWESYVYSDDSILQVSNASTNRVLTVRKTFIDRTADQRISYDDVQKDMQFKIVGTELGDDNNVIYNKTVPYSSFMWVSSPKEGGGTKRELLLIVNSLPPGNYKVSELHSSALTKDGGVASAANTNLSTSVEGEATVKHVDNKGNPTGDPDTPEDAHFAVKPENDTSPDAFFTFTVPQSDEVLPNQETGHTETYVNAEFTNIYTDKDAVSITVNKQWNNGGKSDFEPVKTEFELYADGEKFDLTKYDGGNENGNIELDVAANATSPWASEKTISNLPKCKAVKTVENGTETVAYKIIDWTVKEVSATYRTHANNEAHPTTTVTGAYLDDHFTTVQSTVPATENEPTTINFINTFNNLTSVKVEKHWAVDSSTVDHENDVVYFDLYRTTTNISRYNEDQLRALTGDTSCQRLNLPEEDCKLSQSNSFTYQNDLLEKINNNGDTFYYFALERSVAGYDDTYTYDRPVKTEAGGQGQNDTEFDSQIITITNSRITGEPRGTLTLQKQIAGSGVPTNLDKEYQFTLWNSGKYLVPDKDGHLLTDVKLVPEDQATEAERTFTLKPGETLTLTNIELGTYDLTEVKEAAQIGGYKLTSTAVSVGGADAVSMGEDLKAQVVVTEGTTTVDDPQNPGQTTTQDSPTNVVVTNTYEKDNSEDAKTDFTFGKLWIMPDTDDTTTLPWPNDVAITMRLGRRIKGVAGSEDAGFKPTYTFAKETGYEITDTSASGESNPVVKINNPDVPATISTTTTTTTAEPMNYHHYTFTVKDLPKYDDNGNEWEYFATETAVKGKTTVGEETVEIDLQDPNNGNGRHFTEHYGDVDGIGARILGDENSDTSVAASGSVGYAINQLDITQQISIPVKKIISGRYDLHDNITSYTTTKTENDTQTTTEVTVGTQAEDGATKDFPPFTFGLYDATGHAITITQTTPAGSVEIPVTKTTDKNGKATFDITELVDLNDMMWWSDEQVLTGKYVLQVKEERPYAGTLAPLEYNGITFTKDTVRYSFYVRYVWQTGEFEYLNSGQATSTAKPQMPEAIIVNNYDPGKVSVKVQKTWDDDNNRDGYRKPAQFKVNAYYYDDNGQKVPLDKVWFLKDDATKNEIDLTTYRIELGTKDENSKTVTLPRLHEGHVIYYDVEELLEDTVVVPGEGENQSETLENKYDAEQAVAKIGSKYYQSLRAAVAAATSGDTIELVADDAVSFADGGIVTIDKALTIKGNGHTVKGKSEWDANTQFGTGLHGHGIEITGSGTVTIQNATFTGFGDKHYLNKHWFTPIYANSGFSGKLNLTNLTISNFNREGIVIYGGEFAIDGCTVLGNNDQQPMGSQGEPFNRFQQCIEIRAGSGVISDTTAKALIADNATTHDQVGIVSWGAAGQVTLNNVNVDVVGVGIESDGNTIVITGAQTYARGSAEALHVEGGGSLNIEDGIYEGTVTKVGDSSSIAISGGEFSSQVAEAHCASGYTPSKQLADGMWTVVQLEAIDAPEAITGLTYTGAAQTGVAAGTGYTVKGGTKTNAGTYTATVTLADGYKWSDGTTEAKTVQWTIAQKQVAKPTAKDGLVYNRAPQTGVAAGEGYTVDGGTATDAGSYTVTATTDANHVFTDGTTSASIEWTIGRASATVKADDVVKVQGAPDPTFTTTVTGVMGTDTVSYSLSCAEGDAVGTYAITASGAAEQDNYQVTYLPGTLTIMSSGIDTNAAAYIVDGSGNVTTYTDLASAIAAAADGATVHLNQDVTLSSTLTISKKVVIDGGAHTIQASEDATSVNPLIKVTSTGDLTLANVTVNANGKGRAIVVSSGKLTLNDGAEVTGGATTGSYIGGVYMTGKSELVMNKGSEIAGNSVSSGYANDGYLQYSADLWIGSEAKGTMNGGTVGNLFVNSNDFSQPAAGFTQNGGHITNAYVEYDRGKKASLTHNNGNLTNLYIAQDDAHENGDKHSATQTVHSPAAGTTYSVDSAAARIGSGGGARYYTSFEQAVADAQPGETVTMLADATLSSMITLGKDLTVNLNGHTLARNVDTGSVFQVVDDATLTIDGTTSGSAVVGRLNAGKKTNNNGNLVLNGGTYSCGSGQTVVHVNGTCKNSSVTIKNATITSPDDNGVQLNGAGAHSIENSTISGATAVYLKAGTLTVTGSTLTSTAPEHTAYNYNGNGSNPTGDAIVVDSCAYPGGNPTVNLGADNTITVTSGSGNVQVGYYEANTEQDGYQPGVVTSTTSGGSLPDGLAWAKGDDGTYSVSKAWTVSFDPAGGVAPTDKPNAFADQQVIDGWKAQKPANPTRVGKAFLGWYAAGATEQFDFNTPITSDLTLTARWQDIAESPVPDPYFTNKHTPETINVSVEKRWIDTTETTRGPVTVRLTATYKDDAGVTHSVTHTSIETTGESSPWYEYLANFTDITIYDADANNKWLATWTDLPRYAPGQHGQLVSYTIEELPESIPLGYRQVTDSSDSELTPVNTAEAGQTAQNVIKNEGEWVDIPVKKVWNDDSDRDGLRKDLTSVTMSLSARTADGVVPIDGNFKNSAGDVVSATTDVIGDSSSNEWTSTVWTGLPKYYHGKEITYTVTEDTNGLPKDSSTQELLYTASNNGTVTPVANDADGTRSITNTHAVERTQVTLEKIWEDNTNQDGLRPDVATYVKYFVRLYATVGSNTTQYVIGNSSVQGTTDTYYLYEKKADGTMGSQYRVEGESVQPTAVLYGNHHHGADNYDYIVTFENLPSNAEHGTEITYEVKETDSEGHELGDYHEGTRYTNLTGNINNNDYSMYEFVSSTYDSTARKYTITNRYEPDIIHIKATKEWVAKKGTTLTPEQIESLGSQVKFKLGARVNGNVIDMSAWQTGLHHHYFVTSEKELTKKTTDGAVEWCVEWESLPKHDPAGVEQEITYTVEEIQCPDYYHLTSNPQSLNVQAKNTADKSTVNVTVQNTYEDVSVSATKNWNDENNQDGLRQDVTFQLQEKIGEEGTFQDVSGKTKPVAALNSQAVTWDELPAWKNNKRVYYRVVEVTGDGQIALGDAYTVKDGDTSGTFENPDEPDQGTSTYSVTDNIINTHTPATRPATFTKQWDHKGASDYLTPDQYKAKLHLYVRSDGDNTTPVEVTNDNPTPKLFGTGADRNNDWKSHTTVNKDATTGNYIVTVADLPVNKPQSSEVANASIEKLEYFISEDDLDNYTAVYPEREANSPLKGLVAENNSESNPNEVLLNVRDTGGLKISKAIVSDLATDANKEFTFTITSTQPVTGQNYRYEKTYTSSQERFDTGILNFNAQGNAQVTLKQGQTIQIKNLPDTQLNGDGLPVGVVYTVAETPSEITDFDPSYKISTIYDDGDTEYSSINHTSGTTSSCECTMVDKHNVVVTADFTNSRKTSSLTIGKSIVSAVQEDRDRDYKFEVKLYGLTDGDHTYGGVAFTKAEGTNYHRAEITLDKDHRSKEIDGLPVGATYTIEEIENESGQHYLDKFDTMWTKKLGSDNPSEAVEGREFPGTQSDINTMTTAAATVSFTNTRKVYPLTLTKTLANAIPTDNGDVFYFDVELMGDDNQPLKLDELAQTVTVGGVEMPGTSESGPYYDSETHKIMRVPVTYNFDDQQGTTIISNLPLGTSYAITEHANTDISTRTTKTNIVVATADQTGIIADSGNAKTFANQRETGNLSISKQVVSPVVEERAEDCSYTVEVTLMTKHDIDDTEGHKAPVSIDATLRRGSESATETETLHFGADGKATVTIHHNETVYISGIPTDVTYSIQEVDMPTVTINEVVEPLFTESYTNKSSDIPTNQTAAATVTNTRRTGPLTVSKSVVSPVASDKGRDFAFTVTLKGPDGQTVENKLYGSAAGGMTFTNNVATFNLKNTESKTAEGLPIGWTYTVAESEATGNGVNGISLEKFNTTWTKGGTVAIADSVGNTAFPGAVDTSDVATLTEAASSVAFTNTRKTGTLRLVKTVHSPFPSETGASDDYHDTYRFKVSVQMPADGYGSEKITGDFTATNVTDNKVTFNASGEAEVLVRGSTGETAGKEHYVEISGLPIDMEYTVEETNPDSSIFETPVRTYKGKVPASGAGSQDEDENATHAVVEEGSTYATEVTNTRKVVPVSLYKVSSVYQDTYLAGAEFTMNKMSGDDTSSIDGSWPTRTLISDANGLLVWQSPSQGANATKFNLEPGTYQLIETKAPLGYNKLAKPVTFTVTADGVSYKDQIRENAENYGDRKRIEDNATQSERVVNIFIANATSAELPSTGGSGTAGILAGGFLLISLAAIAHSWPRRRLPQ